MWRAKSTNLKTSNICNEFLVTYLSRRKIQLERRGMDRQALTYMTAINSIKKYLMPIISSQQLMLLHGIGEAICNQLTAEIKRHYKEFLKEISTKVEDTNTMPIWNNSQISQSQRIDDDTKSTEQLKYSLTNSIVGLSEIREDSVNKYSVKSASVGRPFKPRPRTQAAYVLLCIRDSAENNKMQREQLINTLKQNYNQKISVKGLLLILANLKKQGYIERQTEQFSTIIITAKGLKEAMSLQQKTKFQQSKLKIKSVVSTFAVRDNVQQEEIKQESYVNYEKVLVKIQQEQNLVLLIDNREIKDKTQHSFFQKKLVQRYGITCRTCNLPIGDFMWELNGQILDYVIQRKKADDLLGSIHDGRYKQQKYRLKNSCFTNIYYIYESHLTGSSNKYVKQVEKALMNTRINEGFKIVTVSNITETLKFIECMTNQIKRKYKRTGEIQALGSLQQVGAICGKNSQLTVQKIFGLSLKTIPGVGRTTVTAILKYFGSFRHMFLKLSELGNRQDRIVFLRELMKGSNSKSGLSEILVDMLFCREGS